MAKWTLAVFATLLAAACQPGDTPSATSAEVQTPGIASLSAGWHEFSPGGETRCSDGTPYKFYARPGAVEDLLIYMQGGGACWFRENCDPAMEPTYKINLANDQPGAFGIFNFDNPDNPFADYSVVIAPYCTADTHLGASDTVYPPVEDGQEPLTIYHRGRANMQAVLDWTFDNVPDPERVFVTGSSAGSIPSPFYAALVADHYPNAKVAQLGDGAGGYRRAANNDARPDRQWGTFNYINSEPGFETMSRETFNYERLYIAAAKAHPEILFAEFDNAEDAVQKRFLALSGQTDVKLQQALEANHGDIQAEVINFRAYIAGGAGHTILGRPDFYTAAANGTAVRDWVAGLASFADVTDVTCQDCTQMAWAGPPMPEQMQALWASWEDRDGQYVEPFQIFDNVYYVGIDWVAAYLITTSDGLILIDSLYGSWIPQLITNIRTLGFDPADVKYVIATHGHFDHSGGAGYMQRRFGSSVVMTEEDWALTEAKPEFAQFYSPVPQRDVVAVDGDVVELGDTKIELFETPGHTEGVLTMRYTVRDGDAEHTAITLGGVGLNFSGVQRTEAYLDSYARITQLQRGAAVSLPNHAAMGRVFERAAALSERRSGDAHPFVDEAAFSADIAQFILNAESKLLAERSGDTTDPLEALTTAIGSED
jgi:glyoxylase-like metal-dependent hydrolase (beta-lactamase superfamily II)